MLQGCSLEPWPDGSQNPRSTTAFDNRETATAPCYRLPLQIPVGLATQEPVPWTVG
jgi:hypothetical protein